MSPNEPSLLQLLFGLQEPSDETADKLLDAAYAQFVSFGIRRTTMEDVAKQAGVSRITVYRRFADKNRLVEAVILREAKRFFDEFGRAVDGLPTLEERFAEGALVTLRSARANPLLSRMLEAEPEVMLPYLTLGAGPLLDIARVYLGSRLREWKRQGLVPPGFQLDAVAEVLVRLALSFVLTPQSCFPVDDDEGLRAILRQSAAFVLSPLAKGTPHVPATSSTTPSPAPGADAKAPATSTSTKARAASTGAKAPAVSTGTKAAAASADAKSKRAPARKTKRA